ncbi:MAG: hypothetical protein ISS15_14320 [Alphaproteobacteria bacterium]|nr:hypothetical protein [Alphaproteobacteria bacterium]MBL6937492.1 hypothetical protein [Alphaproteobacteria bacterium]MBL7098830.1 hypothetical protein [Alphaproteobacteria bacterium]
MIARAAAGAALALLLFGSADAKPARPEYAPQPAPAGADCVLKHPSKDTLSLKTLPHGIRDALMKLAGGMADRGAFFNATDAIVKPGPFQRFIRAGETQGAWYVWYEHGGLAYWRQIVLFMVDPSGHVHMSANESAHGRDLCEVTDALLDGRTQ